MVLSVALESTYSVLQTDASPLKLREDEKCVRSDSNRLKRWVSVVSIHSPEGTEFTVLLPEPLVLLTRNNNLSMSRQTNHI